VKMRTLNFLAVLPFLTAGPAPGGTLEEVLAAKGIDPETTGDPHLRDAIDHAILREGEFFGIAYRVLEGPEGRRLLGDDLGFLFREGAGGAWSRGRVPLAGIDVDGICQSLGGSPLRLRRSADHLFVEFHLTPSASATLVLTRDFVVRGSFCGWILAVSPAGTVVYQDSMVHFAAVHPTEISVYRPSTDSRRRLYPHEPIGPLRRAYAEKVRRAHDEIGEEWFMVHNHSDDPLLVDGGIERDSIVIDDDAGAVAFIVDFDSRDADARAMLGRHYFGGLEGDFRKKEPDGPMPGEAFQTLHAILKGYAKEEGDLSRRKIRWLLEPDPALARLMGDAMVRVSGDEDDPRAFFLSLDPRWGSLETWSALRRIIDPPSGKTRIAFICRDVFSAKEPGCQEILFDDLPPLFPGASDRAILRELVSATAPAAPAPPESK